MNISRPSDGKLNNLGSGHSPQRLFINDQDGGFVDRTVEVVHPIRYSDRHLSNRPNILLENLGKRRFRRVSEAGGAAGATAGIGESVAFSDDDLDGFIDLFDGSRKPNLAPSLPR